MNAFLRRIMIGAVRTGLHFPLHRFEQALRSPRETQLKTLDSIIPLLTKTRYGRTYGLKENDDLSAFQKKLPIATYESLSSWVDCERNNQPGSIAAEPVLFFERTSGSSGPSKWIPYTPSLKDVFSRLFTLWAADLLYRGPRFRTGKTFISISPKLGDDSGAETDLDYLGWGWQKILDPFWVLPSELSTVRDPNTFRHLLALYLIAEDPEIISIWNPSFLNVILDYLWENREEIHRDWCAGEKWLGGHRFQWSVPANNRESYLQRSSPSWSQLLPSLRLISCWNSAQALSAATRLKKLFPGVVIQGKGLLAAEAPMTLPLISARGCVPLLTDVFFEFEDAARKICLLDEIEVGMIYQIIVTPRGGFGRYRIGDSVQVTHRYFQTPCLEFVGRLHGTSDLVGEKLHESFVSDRLTALGLNDKARVLIPVTPDEGPAYYALAVENNEKTSLAQELDDALSTSKRYQEARLIGQLAKPQIIAWPGLDRFLLKDGVNRGISWGDLKPMALYPNSVSEKALMEFQHGC